MSGYINAVITFCPKHNLYYFNILHGLEILYFTDSTETLGVVEICNINFE